MLVTVRDIGDGFGRFGYQNVLSLNLDPVPTTQGCHQDQNVATKTD